MVRELCRRNLEAVESVGRNAESPILESDAGELLVVHGLKDDQGANPKATSRFSWP